MSAALPAARSNELSSEAPLALVRRVARRLARRLPHFVDLDELVSAGTVGYAEALTRRDAAQAETFRGFAELRVRGAMLDYLRSLDHLSRGARRAAKAIAEVRRLTETSEGRTPTFAELAGIGGSGRAAIAASEPRPASVELEVAERTDADGLAIAASAEDQLGQREEVAELQRARQRLPAREAELLHLLYEEELTLKQVGARLGVTESRACQLRGEAIRKLRDLLAGSLEAR